MGRCLRRVEASRYRSRRWRVNDEGPTDNICGVGKARQLTTGFFSRRVSVECDPPLTAGVLILQIRSMLSLVERDPCAPLTWILSGSILVLHGLGASSRWPSAGCLDMHKRTVFCRNIQRNIQRYWILRRLCRSISCSASTSGVSLCIRY